MGDRADLDRERARRLGRAEPLPPVWRPGDNAFVGRVTTAAPTAGQFLLVHPVTVTGLETEGAIGTRTVNNSVSVPVLLIGPQVPATGDDLLVRWVNYRWVARRSGTAGPPPPPVHQILGCPCTAIPDTIQFQVAHDPPEGINRWLWPAALSWQAKPSDLSTYLIADPGYFSDVKTDTSGDHKYRYYFDCYLGYYSLVYLFTSDSPLGYPAEVPIMTWLVGLPGNTCDPFSLTNGATDNTIFRNQGLSITG